MAILHAGWLPMGFGGPLVGWISNRLGLRRPVLAGSLALTALLWLTLALVPALPLPALAILYLALGAATAGMMIGFTLAREVSAPDTVGAASGVVNTAMTGSGAMTQPLFGWLLDLQWDGIAANGVRVYAASAYGHAALAFVAIQLIGIALAFGLRETHCRPLTGGVR